MIRSSTNQISVNNTGFIDKNAATTLQIKAAFFHSGHSASSDTIGISCAKSSIQLLAGHASAHTHAMWGSLGAALAGPKEFRKYMDGIKWWLIMAQRNDGSYDRFYGRTDGVHGAQNFPTGTTATIFAIKEKALRVTGRPAK